MAERAVTVQGPGPAHRADLRPHSRADARAGGGVLGLRVPDPSRRDPRARVPQQATRGAAGRRGRRPARRRAAGRAVGRTRPEADDPVAGAKRAQALARGRVVLVVSAGDTPVVRLRSDAAREPRRAAGRRCRASAGGRARRCVHRETRGSDRARCPLRRLSGAGPARDEPDGHRHVGHRLLAGRRAQRQPAEAAGGGARARRATCSARSSRRG